MKHLKNIILIFALMIYIPLALNPECGVSSRSVSPYSGKWKIAFTYSNGNTFANAVVIVQDGGGFCGKLKVADTGNEFYVSGFAGEQVSGGFADSCRSYSYVNYNLNGSFSELLGAGYGSGNFSDTLRNPNYKGTWQARRTIN